MHKLNKMISHKNTHPKSSLVNTFQERLEKFRNGDSTRNSNRVHNQNKENIDWKNGMNRTPRGGYENSPQMWGKSKHNGLRRGENPSKALRMINNFIERSNSNTRYKKLAQVCRGGQVSSNLRILKLIEV
jgi:hypothetical protein